MKFEVGDKVKAEVDGQVREGVIKEIDSDSKPYLVYFDGWTRGHNGRGLYKGDHCWWLRDDQLELVKRGDNDMKKSDLKSGAIVETRDGNKYILLLNTKNNEGQKDLLVDLKSGCYLEYCRYSDDLKNGYDYGHDIMKVCQHEYVGHNIRSHITKQNENDWTWNREEETIMTISEIEEKLGISNLKIKKED